MTMDLTQAELEKWLLRSEARVISLTGKWGTGKTEMLNRIVKKSSNKIVSDSLQISLFGVKSIDEMKLRFVAQLAATKSGEREIASFAKDAGLQVVKGVANFFRVGNEVQQLSLLAVPKLLRGRLLVIDDIERKHEKLSIDEVLGFIDEYVGRYECRVLLVLNSDKLKDSLIWNEFREKVIDHEIRLETTAAEVFEIAKNQSHSPALGDSIKSAMTACNVTNIRVARKIVSAVHEFVGAHVDLPVGVLQRTVPSLVLLSATHYAVIEDGPTLEWILEYNKEIDIFDSKTRKQRGLEENKNGRWIKLMDDVGIKAVDSFEVVVSDYLRNGMVDGSSVRRIVDSYLSFDRSAAAENEYMRFMDWTLWNPDLLDADVVRSAAKLCEYSATLSSQHVSTLVDRLNDYEGAGPVCDRLLDGWIDQRRRYMATNGARPYNFELDEWIGQPIHEKLRAAIIEMENAEILEGDFMDAGLDALLYKKWGSRSMNAVRKMTVDDLYNCLIRETGDQLKHLLVASIEVCKHKSTYREFVGDYADNFLCACGKVIEVGNRRAQLIKTSLETSGVEIPISGMEN